MWATTLRVYPKATSNLSLLLPRSLEGMASSFREAQNLEESLENQPDVQHVHFEKSPQGTTPSPPCLPMEDPTTRGPSGILEHSLMGGLLLSPHRTSSEY